MARRRPQLCRTDANHTLIVDELRELGLSVVSLAKVANGCPDICVGFCGVNLLFEIKQDAEAMAAMKKSRSADHLTPEEARWHTQWLGQVATVTSTRQVLEVMETTRGIHLTPAMLAHLLL